MCITLIEINRLPDFLDIGRIEHILAEGKLKVSPQVFWGNLGYSAHQIINLKL